MSDHITELLDDIDRLDADAEAGPWDLEPAVETQNGWSLGTVRSNTTGESVAADIYNSDGALIALSRTALPALSRAVRAVLELPTLPEDTNARYWHNMGLNRAKQTIQRHLEGANDAEKPH